MQQSSEAANMAQIKLCDIPTFLRKSNIIYELRGVISFRRGKNNLRNSVGHYVAYVKRAASSWELFDDLQKKPIPIKNTTIIPCEFLFYTI